MPESLSERAHERIRAMIIRLELAPGDVVREDALREQLDIGRTPIREALQRLAREHFVTVIPRRGMYVSSIDVSELSTLYETRAVLEPYAARLACLRGGAQHWTAMRAGIDRCRLPGVSDEDLLDIDRECHEIIWQAADNRFIRDTLDVLYAQSNRLWYLYLAGVSDLDHAVEEHEAIGDALAAGDGNRASALVEAHIRAFDEQIRAAVTQRLDSPLAGSSPGRLPAT